jgi:uncharacterized membrane protein YdjX (TVP38/TMEM64 family)
MPGEGSHLRRPRRRRARRPAGRNGVPGGIARDDALFGGIRHRAAPRVPDHGALTGMAADPVEGKRRDRTWIKLLLLLFFVVGLAGLLYWTGWIGIFFDRTRLTRFLESLGMWSFAGFIVLQIVQVIAAPIPGEVTGFLGGFLYGPFLGILLNTIGLTAGSVIAFLLSRAFGRPAVDRLVDPKTLGRFDFLLHHKGMFLVFLLFLLPGFPKDYLCYILGLGHLSLFEFVVISAPGRLLGTIMLTFGGSFLRQEKYMELSLLAGAAVIVVFLVLLYKDPLERRFRALQERKRRP